jgi:SAM-dependent methyltransferase
MCPNEDLIAAIRQQFGSSAHDYVTSAAHAAGPDLDILRNWSEGGPLKNLLDVATGGGHTALAFASSYGSVVASDITPAMLDEAREFIGASGATNVEFVVANAESIPFADEHFDAVSCRIAPHHFADVRKFVTEVVRVLRPDGIFLFEDSIAPDDPEIAELLNDLERLRDPTHVRSLVAAEWLKLFAAHNLIVEEQAIDRKRHELVSWLDRSRTPEDKRRRIQSLLARASPAAVSELKLEFDESRALVRHSRMRSSSQKLVGFGSPPSLDNLATPRFPS